VAAHAGDALEPIGIVKGAAAQPEDIREPLKGEHTVVPHLPQKLSVTRFKLVSDRRSYALAGVPWKMTSRVREIGSARALE
jgi:hypothetical protein